MAGIDPTVVGLEFAAGALIGGVAGLAAKKVAKAVAVVVGLQFVIFRYLESRGVVTVDRNAIPAMFSGTGEGVDASGLEILLSTLPLGVGFTIGFAIGFRRG